MNGGRGGSSIALVELSGKSIRGQQRMTREKGGGCSLEMGSEELANEKVMTVADVVSG